MIRAPEVLTPEQLDASAKAKSRNAARLFLIAAFARDKKQRDKLIAKTLVNGAVTKKRNFQTRPAIESAIANIDSDEEGYFRGKPMTHRERAIAAASLAWVLKQTHAPFTFARGKSPPDPDATDAEDSDDSDSDETVHEREHDEHDSRHY